MEWRYASVRFLLLAVLLSAAFRGQAQLAPPDLRCISVLGTAGDVRLDYLPPADPGGQFDRYEVFQASAPAGPFTLVGTVPVIGQTNFVHAGAGAANAVRYYYMRTVTTGMPGVPSVPSDTLATIFLQASQSVPLGSSVLDWNLPHVPPLPSVLGRTNVAMGTSTGTLQQVDSVLHTTHHWQRVVDRCADSLFFTVTLPDQSGCASISSVAKGWYQDITPPSVPVIVQATVDTATNRATLHWDPSPQPDTQGYIIVLNTPGGNTILDTIYGQFNTSYTWPMSNAGNGAESYTVAAIDTCWKGNPPSPNTSAASQPHTTVHLRTRYDRCAGNIMVQRTDYSGWPVAHYELYMQPDQAGPLVLLAVMPPDVQQYLLAGALPGHSYCFVVKAVGTAGQTALSNLTCRNADYPATAGWNYLGTVTVEGPGEVRIEDLPDPAGAGGTLLLERSYNGLPWDTVAMQSAMGLPATFTDHDVLTDVRSYTYRVSVLDSCGKPVAVSNKGTSILLQAEPGFDGINHLRWNGYVQWAGTVGHYAVYRSVADGPYELVGTVPGTQWALEDNVQGFTATPGRFCYYVVAQETGNPAGADASSTSNVACAVQHEEVWIPNAFIEGGANNTFKPVLAYADARTYELNIYNRWGQLIWTTTNPEQAWDGRSEGRLVPQGVYAYYCSFRNGEGKTVVRSGTVTFLPGK